MSIKTTRTSLTESNSLVWCSNKKEIVIGYTGHEHLDMFKIINMNARLYDPVIDLFFSPDPVIQDFENTQCLNRYSYCRNNPVNRVDPTGALDWEPIVNNEGEVVYVPEKGDTKETFKKQFDIDEETANKIFADAVYKTVSVEGGSQSVRVMQYISGEVIKQVTGKNYLSLDWRSEQATTQRKVDQIMFAVKYSQVQDRESFDLKEFNKYIYNSGTGFVASNVTIRVGAKRIPIKVLNVTTDWNTKMMPVGQPPRDISGTYPPQVKQEFRDPAGKYGAPRMLIRMEERYWSAYSQVYYK